MECLRVVAVCLVLMMTQACFSDSGDEGENSGDIEPLPEPEISENLDYIESFARLALIIRFHHPSAGAYDSDWDRFMVKGASKVAQAESQEEFVGTVLDLFQGMAPTVAIDGQSAAGADLEGAEEYFAYLQNGYVDPTLSEEELQMNVYFRARESVSDAEYANEPRYPVDKVYHYRDEFLNADIPLLVVSEDGEEGHASQAFIETSVYELPEGIQNPYNCLSSQANIWGVIAHHFPYFHDVDVDWGTQLRPLLAACESGDIYDQDRAMRQALTKLGDNHMSFGLADAPNPQGGYMPEIAVDKVEGRVTVVWLGEDMEEPGLGDELLKVNGEDVESLIAERKPYSLRAENRQSDQVITVNLLRGNESDSLVLELMNDDGTVYELDVITDQPFNAVRSEGRNALTDSGLSRHEELDNGIHYVNLSATSADQVEETIDDLSGAEGVILDLRNYPEDFMGWFNFLGHFSEDSIPSGPMYLHYINWPEFSERHVEQGPQFIEPRTPHVDVPTVVLASRYSGSQNEHALAYVQNAGLPIVGEATYGINGNVAQIRTFGGMEEGGANVIFTGMEVRQNDDTPLIGRGIQPDTEQPLTVEGIREGRDVQLERALEYLQ